MPRLPSEFDLGGLPNLNSGRPVATIDTSAVGEGIARLGIGMAQAGAALSRIGTAQDQLDVARARAAFLTEKIKLDEEFANDTNYQDLKPRYEQRLREIHEQSASFVNNPRARELFALSTADDVAKGVAHADVLARKQEADANIADANTRLSQIRESALRVQDEEERVKLIETGKAILDGLVQRGFITRQNAQSVWENWRRDYAKAWIGIQPPDKQIEILSDAPITDDQINDRILRNEGKAKNPKSSATGLGQFIDSTWLDVVKRYRPDLAAGKSDAEILALRADDKLARAMTDAYRRENVAYLTQRGIPATPGNQYLAHFLGPAGAAAVLSADPGRPVQDVLTEAVGEKQAAAMVRANMSILGGKTAGTVVQWAARKMGQEGGSVADFLPYDQRVALRQQAEQNLIRLRTAEAGARQEQYERLIIDASAGRTPLIAREQIENDPVLSEDKRNTLLRQYDQAAGDVVALQNVLAKFQNPAGGPFNPFDKDEAKAVDKIYALLGGDTAALQAVVDRTKTVPQTAIRELRGGIVSNDPKRVAETLTVASNIMARSPQIFSVTEGGKDIEEATIAFRHYTQDFGMPAEQAAAKIIQMNSPEYQSKIKAVLKNEDIDAKLTKDIQNGTLESELKSAFNLSVLPFGRRPQIEINPEARKHALQDYAELVREYYLQHGDEKLAKQQAQAVLKGIWGVSYINGSSSGVFMRFPPDRAPAFANIPDVSSRIAEQAIAAIKEETGRVVERSKLMLTPTTGGETAQAYTSNQPPPYVVSWVDEDGFHTLNPGRVFVPDAKQMYESISEERRKEFEAARAAAQTPFAPMMDVSRQEARNRPTQPAQPPQSAQPTGPTIPTSDDDAALRAAREERAARLQTLRERQSALVLP